ncbi:MAG: DUF4331 family protein, partial [Chloroflexota bacterium]
MKHFTPLVRTGTWLLAAAALAGVLAVGSRDTSTQAADHLDAPGAMSPGGDGRLDITDVYAFKHDSNTVLIMSVNPAAGLLSPTAFHPNASYDFKVDTDGDAKEDTTYRVTFSAANAGTQDVMLRRVSGGGARGAVLARGKTGENIAVTGGGMIRAGLFDDPFFFDLNAFKGTAGRAFCDAGTANFFAGFNVTAIVLEVPSSSFPFSNIGVWARTELNGEQIDRMGRPAINTVFIPSGSKNAYNAG